jgi:hypothetical protein
VEIVRMLARIEPGARIASILNRNRRRTAHGQRWTARRICSLRNNHGIPVYREGERQDRGEMSVSEAAGILATFRRKISPPSLVGAARLPVSSCWSVQKRLRRRCRPCAPGSSRRNGSRFGLPRSAEGGQRRGSARAGRRKIILFKNCS